MENQLRLVVAQLTDVGKKREHNEDNMAYVIPKDTQVMAMKGALFIVADGMGGHAAGEVASEIAVDTVSNVYYMDDNTDVVPPLLQAIKRANAAIHQRASENMLRSGMGTTCVTAVLRGNMAYIANVGDSRAYLIRQGQVKQISLDHSWVAEQVRAGLLTDEQARTHAQRNVITRSLGTQPDVEVDVFREALQPSDTLVLCTDGLSGLVSDEELMRIVEQSIPQESVYHLVERANENGGPDNITAIVVRVEQLGVEPPAVRNPALVGGREVSEEETIALNMLSGSNTYSLGDGRISSGPLRLSSGPLASPESVTAPQPALARARRSRLFFPTLLLIFLIIIALAGGGVFYALRLNESQTISQTLNAASQLITLAQKQAKSNPAQALKNLASAQSSLQELQRNHQLDPTQTGQFNTLQKQLVTETQTAIGLYNTQSKIDVLPCSGTVMTPLNAASAKVQTTSMTAVSYNNGTLLFALGSDGSLYQLTGNGQANSQPGLVSVLPVTKTTKILAIASRGSKLYLLNEQLGASGTPTGVYSVAQYTFTTVGTLGKPVTAGIDPQSVKGGFTPAPLLTAWDNNAYVVLSSLNQARIIDYTFDPKANSLKPSKPYSISISQTISSIATFSDRFFILLNGGAVQSFPLAAAFGPQATQTAPTTAPTVVNIPTPIQTPLTATQTSFNSSTIVPTVTPQEATGQMLLVLSNASQLSVGLVNQKPHLYIGDSVNHRVIDLTEASSASPAHGPTSVTMHLEQQFVYLQYLPTFKSITGMTVEPSGTSLHLLVQQNNPTQVNLVTVSTGPQIGCSK